MKNVLHGNSFLHVRICCFSVLHICKFNIFYGVFKKFEDVGLWEYVTAIL